MRRRWDTSCQCQFILWQMSGTPRSGIGWHVLLRKQPSVKSTRKHVHRFNYSANLVSDCNTRFLQHCNNKNHCANESRNQYIIIQVQRGHQSIPSIVNVLYCMHAAVCTMHVAYFRKQLRGLQPFTSFDLSMKMFIESEPHWMMTLTTLVTTHCVALSLS